MTTPNTAPNQALTVTDRITLDRGRPFFAVEFFPPKDDQGEADLWRAIRRLEPLDPAYVSVTYGAGGSSRDRTVRTVGRIATDTTLVAMAHLTAVSHSVTELRHVIGSLAAHGIRSIMALRGDPPGKDPLDEWEPHPEGLMYADELVDLCKRSGPFCVGVAAFPYGHPRSEDLESDTEKLVGKFRAGAEFAVTQLFLEPDGFLRLRDRVTALGFDQPIIPGIMPLTSEKTFHKGPELSGSPLPEALVTRLDPYTGDQKSFRAAGMEVTGELCERLLAEGVPGIHFYSLNRSTATTELVDRLGLATPAPAPTA